MRRALDLNGQCQWEGRILAIRFQGFWVLGVYMPHKDDQYSLLCQQMGAWIQLQSDPVMVMGDMNTVLDPLESGVRVCQNDGLFDVNYFARHPATKWAMLSTRRQHVFNMWLETCGLTDVLDLMSVPVSERRHTCYFRAAGALKAECGHTSKEPSVPTGLALGAGLQVVKVTGGEAEWKDGTARNEARALASRIGQHMVTTRIDGIFASQGIGELLELV